jgi:hypothetical protein
MGDTAAPQDTLRFRTEGMFVEYTIQKLQKSTIVNLQSLIISLSISDAP